MLVIRKTNGDIVHRFNESYKNKSNPNKVLEKARRIKERDFPGKGYELVETDTVTQTITGKETYLIRATIREIIDGEEIKRQYEIRKRFWSRKSAEKRAIDFQTKFDRTTIMITFEVRSSYDLLN